MNEAENPKILKKEREVWSTGTTTRKALYRGKYRAFKRFRKANHRLCLDRHLHLISAAAQRQTVPRRWLAPLESSISI